MKPAEKIPGKYLKNDYADRPGNQGQQILDQDLPDDPAAVALVLCSFRPPFLFYLCFSNTI